MILRKPYAFLIKHFRIIHLFLLLPIAYLIGKTAKIVSFFRTYVSNNYTTSLVNIAAEHISFFMYLAVLIIIIVVIAIYYLMRQKEKSTKLYFFTLLYYLFLFVLIGVTHSILSNMEHDIITAQTARAYRDVSTVLCLPQYFFLVYVFIRGIGFDIKKFNFANDLKDMEITDVDSEEFEFAINVEGYKVERTARRFIREFKYYVQENTFVFSCIVAVFVIFIGTALYLNFGVYNRTYHVSDKMTHNFFTIQITDSMITNIGYDGNVITEGKYYLAIKLYIENKTNKNYELDYTNFRLVLNGKNVYPTLDRGEYFVDYGKPYYKEKIKKQTKDYYVLVYEIAEADLTNEYKIKILEGIDYKVGEIAATYKTIKLNPPVINSVQEVETISLGKTANFKNSNLGYTTFKINNYALENSYTYEYDHCYSENNCTRLKDKITTNISGSIEKTILLVLDMEYNLDQTTIYANNIKTDTKYFDHFFSLYYEKEGSSHIISLNNKTSQNMENVVVFETRQEILNADKIDLLVTVRNKKYTFHLK